MNILFVCSRNQWRSPTAEAVYRNRPGVFVRSAGTESSARIKLNLKMIQWADVIFVMEKKHKQRILEKFGSQAGDIPIITLNIPDDYQFMNPELVDDIRAKVDCYLTIGNS